MKLTHFLELFKIQKEYTSTSAHDSFIISKYDSLEQTNNSLTFIFEENLCQLILSTTEFDNQKLTTDSVFEIRNGEIFPIHIGVAKNEIFPSLNFDKNLDDSLKTVAHFTNEVLTPKYNLNVNVSY